eukprot:CAMPEP_0202792138 /NCGR_PEP_ID=MMETSP1388-20130828/83068_1 /ASSEMBLY_ACC=CAM_ASM_000864 /TAXON_ID=37098 /ORGANISM="Isochrysis sp, Strain CCMP1244" /LENGTH=150 /DNA_ID=CAMNT_0049461921 /DNA_START=8 /DNA_END=457 /DNA_ORIENTATION=-
MEVVLSLSAWTAPPRRALSTRAAASSSQEEVRALKLLLRRGNAVANRDGGVRGGAARAATLPLGALSPRRAGVEGGRIAPLLLGRRRRAPSEDGREELAQDDGALGHHRKHEVLQRRLYLIRESSPLRLARLRLALGALELRRGGGGEGG